MPKNADQNNSDNGHFLCSDSSSSKLATQKSWLQFFSVMEGVWNEVMSFEMIRNHLCRSLSNAGLVHSNYQLYRIETPVWYPPQLIADLSFPLRITNNKVNFSIVFKEQKRFLLPIPDITNIPISRFCLQPACWDTLFELMQIETQRSKNYFKRFL